MREQLIQYVELLFAGAPDCEEMKQEILQNTLDRYDDLLSQGKVPAAAYRLAISGIGDINEILGTQPQHTAAPSPLAESQLPQGKRMRAIAVALYILCPIPVILLGSTRSQILSIVGVCGLLGMIAAATALMFLYSEPEDKDSEKDTPAELKNLNSIISAAALILFFVVSFLTGSWYITWLIFPIAGAVKKLIRAIYDYREENMQ